MKIRVFKDGEPCGPYSVAEVFDLIGNGTLNSADLGFSERHKTWIPLSEILYTNQNRISGGLSSHPMQNGYFDLPEILALVGSLLLFLGLFTPVVSEPLAGGMNFLKVGWPAYLIICFAAACMAAVFMRTPNILWGIGGMVCIDLLGCLIGYFVELDKMKSDVGTKLGTSGIKQLDELGQSLGNAYIESVQLQWGCFILGLGAFLILTAAFLFGKRQSMGYPNS